MNDFNRQMAGQGRAMDMGTDIGLRSFMLGVYNKLALGIALAGVIAYIAGNFAPITNVIYSPPIMWIVMFAPVALILGSNFFMRNPSPFSSGLLYWAVVSTMGLSMGVYFVMAKFGVGGVTTIMITKAFLITSAMFGGLSLYGYTTKRDLGPIGAFAFMGIWAAFIIGMVFFILPMIFPSVGFLQSSMIQMVISGAFALFSAIIIAWQTQSLKEGYYQLAGDQRGMAVMTNWGALTFFISFINIFQFVMSILSSD